LNLSKINFFRFYGKNMIEINYVDFDNVLAKYCQMIDEQLE